MKTREQILEWLDKQYWKKEFYEASLLHGNIRAGYNYDKNFLRDAFCWDETAQVEKIKCVVSSTSKQLCHLWRNNYEKNR